MTEEQLKQFAKRPPGQYRRPDFYWRGGDPLKEQEFLREEYKKALADLRLAQQRYEQVQNEVADANDVLKEREGYTHALSSYLERDTALSAREIDMKKHLSNLEKEIDECESQLDRVHTLQNPAALSQLNKEKAYYMIEIQRGQKSVQNNYEIQNEAKRQMAACTVNGRYRRAINLEYELEKVTIKKNHLRKLVARTKIDFEALRAVSSKQDQVSRSERSALQKNIRNEILLLRLEERKKTRVPKHAAHLNNLLEQVEELNARMEEIGLGDELVDVEELRERVFRDDDSEEELPESDGEEDEFQHSDDEVGPAGSTEQEPEPEPELKERSVPKEEEKSEDEAEPKKEEEDFEPSEQKKEEEDAMDDDFEEEKKASEAEKMDEDDFEQSEDKKLDEDDFEQSEDKKESEAEKMDEDDFEGGFDDE